MRLDQQLVDDEVSHGQCQRGGHEAVEALFRLLRGRRIALDLGVALEALRGQLEDPRDDHHRDETDGQYDDGHADVFAGESERLRQRVHDLHDEPGHGDVARGHPQDIAALQFTKDRHC